MLLADEEPRDLYSWDCCPDEWEFQTVPWWAPKWLIGHFYIRFECNSLELPEQITAEIKQRCADRLRAINGYGGLLVGA